MALRGGGFQGSLSHPFCWIPKAFCGGRLLF